MTTPRKTYKHVASAREAVEHICGHPPQQDTLSDVLRYEVEKAETDYENAITSKSPTAEIERLQKLLDGAKREEDQVRDLITELNTAGDNLASGRAHPTLVLSPNSNYGPGHYFTKASLFYWAKERLGGEIADWKQFTDEAPSSYSDGEKLFIVMASLLDQLLTSVEGDWRAALNNDASGKGNFVGNGRLKKTAIANRIIDGLPAALPAKDISANIKGHFDLLADYLVNPPQPPQELSSRQTSKALRTVFGLARAVHTAPRKPPKIQDQAAFEDGLLRSLSDRITSSGPLKAEDVTDCLQKAKAEVQGLCKQSAM